MDLDGIETECPGIKALRKSAVEFETYIANNKDMIPNYAERRRYGKRVSTGFVESTVNTVAGKRFGKKQQMCWSKQGAHLMLQTRTRTLDGTLRTKFEQWHPGDESSGRYAHGHLIAPHYAVLSLVGELSAEFIRGLTLSTILRTDPRKRDALVRAWIRIVRRMLGPPESG